MSSGSTTSDTELLQAYTQGGDDAAFAGIVQRHGSMVYRTCLRTTGNAHDAEDAAQAAFVVLARKAKRLRAGGDLGAWLHEVARRVSLEAARARARQARHEQEAVMLTQAQNRTEAVDAVMASEALPLLDKALASLPANLRQAVILRHLEGHTQEEAARIAGCPQGTLAWRTSKGLERLRRRLQRYGAALSALALVTFLEQEAHAAVPASSLSAMAVASSAAVQWAVGGGKVIALAEASLRSMFLARVASIVLTLSAVGLLSVGAVAAGMAISEAHASKHSPPQQETGAADMPLRGIFVYPCKGYVRGLRGKGNFGLRVDKGDAPFVGSYHVAEDVWLPAGTAVHSIGRGTVVYSDFSPTWTDAKGSVRWNLGNVIIIEHTLDPPIEGLSAVCSVYVHLGADRKVQVGQKVERNQIIGAIGKDRSEENGRYPAHLHFGIHKGPYYQISPAWRRHIEREAREQGLPVGMSQRIVKGDVTITPATYVTARVQFRENALTTSISIPLAPGWEKRLARMAREHGLPTGRAGTLVKGEIDIQTVKPQAGGSPRKTNALIRFKDSGDVTSLSLLTGSTSPGYKPADIMGWCHGYGDKETITEWLRPSTWLRAVSSRTQAPRTDDTGTF